MFFFKKLKRVLAASLVFVGGVVSAHAYNEKTVKARLAEFDGENLNLSCCMIYSEDFPALFAELENYNCAEVTSIDLRSNRIEEVPEDFKITFSGLKNLNLSLNAHLSMDTLVNVPSSLKKLELCDVHANAIPDDFSTWFPHLEELVLSRNFLNSNQNSLNNIPDCVHTLDLSENGLEGFPVNFFHKYSFLKKLSLSFNNLTNDALFKFPSNIKILEIEGNPDLVRAGIYDLQEFLDPNSVRNLDHVQRDYSIVDLDYCIARPYTKEGIEDLVRERRSKLAAQSTEDEILRETKESMAYVQALCTEEVNKGRAECFNRVLDLKRAKMDGLRQCEDQMKRLAYEAFCVNNMARRAIHGLEAE